MTAALQGGEWSAARPGRTLPPGKARYPFYRRLGGPQGRSERAENLVPTGIRSRTVQPVVSRYTDWATGPTINKVVINILNFKRFAIEIQRMWNVQTVRNQLDPSQNYLEYTWATYRESMKSWNNIKQPYWVLHNYFIYNHGK